MQPSVNTLCTYIRDTSIVRLNQRAVESPLSVATRPLFKSITTCGRQRASELRGRLALGVGGLGAELNRGETTTTADVTQWAFGGFTREVIYL